MYQERLLTNIFHIQPGHNLCFPVPYAYTMCPDSYFIVFYNYFSNSLTFLSICCCGKIIDYNTISVSIITCNLQIQSFNVLSYNCFRFNINIYPCKKIRYGTLFLCLQLSLLCLHLKALQVMVNNGLNCSISYLFLASESRSTIVSTVVLVLGGGLVELSLTVNNHY